MRNADALGVAILLLHGAGAPILAAWLYEFLGSSPRVRYAHAYLLVLVWICGWGALWFDPRSLFGTIGGLSASVPIGIVAGCLATTADRGIVGWRTPTLRRTPHRRALPWYDSQRLGVDLRSVNSVSDAGFALWSLLAIAALEEIIFRGWFLEVTRLIPSVVLTFAALGASVVLFAMLHIRFGWLHTCAKLPLGTFSLIGVLLTGSLLAPVLTHCYFNWCVWRDRLAE
jgi:Type II CAAX prenyl endopeptidase Rce1-like